VIYTVTLRKIWLHICL